MASGSLAVGNAHRDASVPVGSPPEQEKMTRREHWLAGFGCALSGLMTLLPFQFVVILLPVLSHHFLDQKQLGNSMLGLYQAVCVLILCVILRIGALHKWLIHGGLTLSLVCMAALPPASFYGSLTCRIVLIHIVLGLLGSCNAMLQAASFARAAILPINYVGTTSIGQATAGLIAFIVTSVLMNCVYDMNVEEDVKWFTSICCGICVVACALSLVYMRVFLNARVSVQSVDDAIQTSGKNEQDNAPTIVGDIEEVSKPSGFQDETLLPPRPWLTTIKAAFWELLSVFLVFFVTFSLFPKVGPIFFNFEGKAPAKMVWLFGMQFAGDFLGRSCLKLSTVHPIFSWVFLSRKATIAASFLRILFYIPFFLAMKMENTFFNNFAWLMFIQLFLAFTLGWIGTNALIHCSLSVSRVSEKARMGSLSTIVLAIGITVGLYLAMAF